jgi:hypothetical protein
MTFYESAHRMKTLCAACLTLFPGLLANAADTPPSADGFNLPGHSLRHQNNYDQALAAYPPSGAA